MKALFIKMKALFIKLTRISIFAFHESALKSAFYQTFNQTYAKIHRNYRCYIVSTICTTYTYIVSNHAYIVASLLRQRTFATRLRVVNLNDPCGQVACTVYHRLRPSIDSDRLNGRRKRLETVPRVCRGSPRPRGSSDHYDSHSQ